MSNNNLLVFLVIMSPVNRVISSTLPNSPGSEKQDLGFVLGREIKLFSCRKNAVVLLNIENPK